MKRDTDVLKVRRDLTNARRGAAKYGFNAELIAVGGVREKVEQAARRVGRWGRRPRGAAVQLLFSRRHKRAFQRAGARAMVGHQPSMWTLALIRRAALRWKGLVGTGKKFDFKWNKLLKPKSTSCPRSCPNTVTLCPRRRGGDCYRTDVPGNLSYAYIGRFVGWSRLALQLGSQYAQLTKRKNPSWDPPEDTWMVRRGYYLPQNLTRANFCAAIHRYRSRYPRSSCENCPEALGTGVTGSQGSSGSGFWMNAGQTGDAIDFERQ